MSRHQRRTAVLPHGTRTSPLSPSVSPPPRCALFLASQQSPQPRRPRRMLKKRTPKEGDTRRRKRNRRRHAETSSQSAAPFGTILPGIARGNNNGNNANNGANSSDNKNINNNRMAAAATTPTTTTQEYRPLVPSVRRDMGEDYWIDPVDLEREQRRIEEQEKQRQKVVASIASGNGGDTISQEKLMTEVKAPYRQNWIGYFSVMVAVLSIIVSQFPELLEPTPTIRFPDL
mmetsp:Transcript_18707/g.42565  ORF Transcript_18707/g.42565 Transcript_18707/m.42565 type:complete len:231 (-) Transcript_18707:2332-3024(-)